MKRKYLYIGGACIAALALWQTFRPKAISPLKTPATKFRFSIETKHKKMTLVIPVTTSKMQKIRVRVWDYTQPKTYFTDRFMQFVGTENFEVMMPMTPEKIMVEVVAETNKDVPFSIGEIRREPLKQRLDLIDLFNPKIRNFIKFAQEFAFNASYLESGQTYMSDNKKFFIEYLPVITYENGNAMNTSARINEETGKIQVSKRDFDMYTVPGRLAVLFHEFSHFFINDNKNDESEADLNGLLIYLSLGYPRVEAFEVWADVFDGAKTAANEQRFQLILKFVDDYENNRLTLK